MRLQGKVAVVTGAAMGIGRGIAEEFVKEGARVVVADVNDSAGAATAHQLAEGGKAVEFQHCDVSQEADVARLMDAARRLGGPHVVVNNAAVGIYKHVLETTVEEFDRALAVNLRGVFLGIKYGAMQMRGSGGGAIVNIASVHAVQNVGGTAPYAAAKGGVAALTREAAIDLAALGIRVNAICPGWIYTPLIKGIFDGAPNPDEMKRQVEKRQLLGRLGTPAEIGRAAVFLASEDSSYVTGSLLFVDAGMTAQLETWSG
jgi:NAD(P)-dependent dehydrogenase (short-subunit alcohol dehydrogenase family)